MLPNDVFGEVGVVSVSILAFLKSYSVLLSSLDFSTLAFVALISDSEPSLAALGSLSIFSVVCVFVN